MRISDGSSDVCSSDLVGGLYRRAAPDAQARRGVAIARDVIGGAFLLQQGGEALDEGFVRALYRQADAGGGAGSRIGGEMAQPVHLLDNPVPRRRLGVAARKSVV